MADLATTRPASAEEVREIVAEAAAAGTPLAPTGLGSKAAIGRPTNHRRLDLSGLSGVTLYEPAELVLSALAGTPVDEINGLLAANNQELAFEPMSHAALLGTGAGTLGGLLMTNQSGPRRIKAGAARDHVLGVKAVSGRGEAFKTGGRVVKNVTGYDLSKGLAGSYGTLAVATEITVKVLPKAETEATLVLEGLDPRAAVAALATAMGTPADVSGAAHLPPAAAAALGIDGPATLIRLEGVEPSVRDRFDSLSAQLRAGTATVRLDAEPSRALWRRIRDAEPVARPADRAVWRVSVAPTAGPAILEAVPDAVGFCDWSGGLVWLAVDPAGDASAAAIRAAIVRAGGGHATLIRGTPDLRARVPVFQPQPAPLAALVRRLKAEFDPAGILNPGRMGEGH